MERLVFNRAEHKFEELEKYGFVFNIKNNEYRYESIEDKFCSMICINFDFEYEVNFISYDDIDPFYYPEKDLDMEVLCKLYDLIKDGLVVKEKQNEDIMC